MDIAANIIKGLVVSFAFIFYYELFRYLRRRKERRNIIAREAMRPFDFFIKKIEDVNSFCIKEGLPEPLSEKILEDFLCSKKKALFLKDKKLNKNFDDLEILCRNFSEKEKLKIIKRTQKIKKILNKLIISKPRKSVFN